MVMRDENIKFTFIRFTFTYVHTKQAAKNIFMGCLYGLYAFAY